MAIKKSKKAAKRKQPIQSAQLRIQMWKMLKSCAFGEENDILKSQRELQKFPKELRTKTFKDCVAICKGVWSLSCIAELDHDKYIDRTNEAAKMVADTIYDQHEVKWAYEIVNKADHAFRMDLGLVRRDLPKVS